MFRIASGKRSRRRYSVARDEKGRPPPPVALKFIGKERRVILLLICILRRSANRGLCPGRNLGKKLDLLLGIRHEQKNWDFAQEIARGLRLEFPDEVDWWISEAYATRRCDSIERAREILLKGLTLHEDSSIIRYNLACYACVLLDFQECMSYLTEAVKRDEKYRHGGR